MGEPGEFCTNQTTGSTAPIREATPAAKPNRAAVLTGALKEVTPTTGGNQTEGKGTKREKLVNVKLVDPNGPDSSSAGAAIKPQPEQERVVAVGGAGVSASRR